MNRSASGEKGISWASKKTLPWIIPLSLLLIWIFISELKLAPPYLFPHPLNIAESAYFYIFGNPADSPYAGRFINDVSYSILRVSIGFGIAAFLGIPLGILSGRLESFQLFISSTLNAIRAVPGICWLPLALVWFGIGIKTTVFLVALAAFFPIYINSASGARLINPLLYQSGAMMGVGKIRGIYAILLPAAMPQIITGLRLGLGIAWAYLVLGELTGVPNGLGAVIMDARMLGRIDIILVGVIIIAVLGRISDLSLKAVLRLCFKSARRT